ATGDARPTTTFTRAASLDDPIADRPLREQPVGTRHLYVQDGVTADQVDWVVRGCDLAERAISQRLGLPAPRAPLALYLLADQSEFRLRTSQLTGLPLETIGQVEGGRAYHHGARRGIYLDAAALPAAPQAAHLVGHELVHLAERDALGAGRLPLWFSEGLAEYVGQEVMAAVDPTAAGQRRWRRAA